MNAEETTRLLMEMQVAYPTFKVSDKATAIKVWTENLMDLPYEVVRKALRRFISLDTKGFAPSIGQLRASIVTEQEELPVSEAWSLVLKALGNGIYGAEEEFNRLPPDVRRAVGGPSVLRSWATMDDGSIEVAASNFRRAYDAICDKRRSEERLPADIRMQIGEAPVAMIPENVAVVENDGRADPEWVTEMLTKAGWRDEI